MQKSLLALFFCSLVGLSSCKKQPPVEPSHETCYPMNHRQELAATIDDPAAKKRFLDDCHLTDVPAFDPAPPMQLQ